MKKITSLADLSLIQPGVFLLWNKYYANGIILEVVTGSILGDEADVGYDHTEYYLRIPEQSFNAIIQLTVTNMEYTPHFFIKNSTFVSSDTDEILDHLPVHLVIHNVDIFRKALRQLAWVRKMHQNM